MERTKTELKKRHTEYLASGFNDIIRIATCERNAMSLDIPGGIGRLRQHLEGLRIIIGEQLLELDTIEKLAKQTEV